MPHARLRPFSSSRYTTKLAPSYPGCSLGLFPVLLIVALSPPWWRLLLQTLSCTVMEKSGPLWAIHRFHYKIILFTSNSPMTVSCRLFGISQRSTFLGHHCQAVVIVHGSVPFLQDLLISLGYSSSPRGGYSYSASGHDTHLPNNCSVAPGQVPDCAVPGQARCSEFHPYSACL